MIDLRTCGRYALGFAVALSLTPGVAFASSIEPADDVLQSGRGLVLPSAGGAMDCGEAKLFGQLGDAEAKALADIAEALKSNNQGSSGLSNQAGTGDSTKSASGQQGGSTSTTRGVSAKKATASKKASTSKKTDKVLSFDRSLIEQVGTQESTGHTICCPSFSCAYGDVVLDGTVHDHDYYTCSCCTWTDWGGGGSSNRCVGSDEELLREAYDQIKAGKPTVIHVAGSSGEHWICLIGYQNAKDPDHLNLSNFIALDPWDGAQIVASERYSLYGDGCEHVSDR